jgi:hypothetical protein
MKEDGTNMVILNERWGGNGKKVRNAVQKADIH